jgi:signal transduction histidine kinase
MILIDNAIKYSPADCTVTVRILASQGHGQVIVRDEGYGIPAEELPHVFDRFYRGRASGTAHQGGSGLGLAIAKWLVEKQGGEVGIESREGQFTEVRLRVPRVEMPGDVQAPGGRMRDAEVMAVDQNSAG